MVRWLAVVLIGCGRIGFDAHGDATSDGASPLAQRLPCESRVVLDTGNDLPQDGIAVVNDSSAYWMLVSEHVACDMHPIERFAIDFTSTSVALRDTGVVTQTTHAHTVTIEPAAGGYVMGYVEANDGTTHVTAVAPGLTATGDHSFVLNSGNPPLARAGGGPLAVIGLQSGAVVVLGIDDTGAGTGVKTVLESTAANADQPTMVAAGAGLAAVWQSNITGACRVALLRADLSLAAGPVDMTFGRCTGPQIALVDGTRIVVVAQDATSAGLYGAVWDTALAPTVPPFQIAPLATSPRLVAQGSVAWVAWADSSTYALGHAMLGLDGTVTPHAAAGQQDTAVPHYEVLQLVAGEPIAMWLDVAQNRSLAAMRFCN